MVRFKCVNKSQSPLFGIPSQLLNNVNHTTGTPFGYRDTWEDGSGTSLGHGHGSVFLFWFLVFPSNDDCRDRGLGTGSRQKRSKGQEEVKKWISPDMYMFFTHKIETEEMVQEVSSQWLISKTQQLNQVE